VLYSAAAHRAAASSFRLLPLLIMSMFPILRPIAGVAAVRMPSLVENKGLEPLTPCVQGRCSKPTELIPRLLPRSPAQS
jgi:hypothetical protein